MFADRGVLFPSLVELAQFDQKLVTALQVVLRSGVNERADQAPGQSFADCGILFPSLVEWRNSTRSSSRRCNLFSRVDIPCGLTSDKLVTGSGFFRTARTKPVSFRPMRNVCSLVFQSLGLRKRSRLGLFTCTQHSNFSLLDCQSGCYLSWSNLPKKVGALVFQQAHSLRCGCLTGVMHKI